MVYLFCRIFSYQKDNQQMHSIYLEKNGAYTECMLVNDGSVTIK